MGELEFRDGKRNVPDYMEDLMAGLPLHKLTYAQAIGAMNAQQVQNVIDRNIEKIVDRHMEDIRRGPG